MWYLYIAICHVETLYTGITTNLVRREYEHNFDTKRGAKSLRNKRPIKIVYYESYSNQSEARIREADIKSRNRKYKLTLISGFTQKITE